MTAGEAFRRRQGRPLPRPQISPQMVATWSQSVCLAIRDANLSQSLAPQLSPRILSCAQEEHSSDLGESVSVPVELRIACAWYDGSEVNLSGDT